jgi:hypothetical protein
VTSRQTEATERHTRNTTTLSLSYLCDIFCVACFSKSPSFPAIAQCWRSATPVCRGDRRVRGGARFLVRAAGTATWGWARQSTTAARREWRGLRWTWEEEGERGRRERKEKEAEHKEEGFRSEARGGLCFFFLPIFCQAQRAKGKSRDDGGG